MNDKVHAAGAKTEALIFDQKFIAELMDMPEASGQSANIYREKSTFRPCLEALTRSRSVCRGLNKTLFSGTLPNFGITFTDEVDSTGWFAPDYVAAPDGSLLSLVAFNPGYCSHLDLKTCLSSMAFQLARVWAQEHCPTTGRDDVKTEYNLRKTWVDVMDAIGLEPLESWMSPDDEIKAYIYIPGGKFEKAYRDFRYGERWQEWRDAEIYRSLGLQFAPGKLPLTHLAWWRAPR